MRFEPIPHDLRAVFKKQDITTQTNPAQQFLYRAPSREVSSVPRVVFKGSWTQNAFLPDLSDHVNESGHGKITG